MKYGISLTLTLGFLGACTTTLTPEGQTIKVINTNMAKECEFVAFINEHNNGGRSAEHEINNAILDTKNKAAELGANSVEILDTGFDIFLGGIVKANAYKCDSW